MTFQDDLNRMFGEAFAEMNRDLPPLTDSTTVAARRHTAWVEASLEQLVDSGAISEADARAQGWTPYVPPPVPWSRRLRWRWQAWRERAGRKIGGWIAGEDLSERNEDW